MNSDFVHRTVSAPAAQRVETNAPNSVFALGGPPVDSSPTRKVRSDSRWPKALELFERRGAMSAQQLGAALEISLKAARNLVTRMLADKTIAVASSHTSGPSHPRLYDLAQRCGGDQPPSDFKTWLAKTGQESAEGRVPPQAAPGPSTPDDPKVITGHGRGRRALARIDPVPSPQLTCGLLNTGELLIEAGEQRMRLDRIQARSLVSYLDLVSKTLQAVS
ncbi:hypothetical protein [Caldimonas sp. KR1-144]|uniref:hypothetical protein n=1 Tax=Caldimonas sp. KR1-144 TaxID=3400911 RepID=UPI003C0CA60F